MAKTPAITICLPNLNTRPFLPERMETILAQTFKDWELIILDSYSDDGSWEFLQSYSGHPQIRVVQAPRRGIYGGWNDCLSLATGEYIYIATSDDTACNDLLEKLHNALEQSPGLSIAMCDFQLIDAASRPIETDWDRSRRAFLGDWANIPSIRDGRVEFLLMCALSGPTWVTMTSILFRRSMLKKIGLFPTNRGAAGDYEWGMRAVLKSDIAYVPGRLATFRIRADQYSSRGTRAASFRNSLACIRSVIRDSTSGIPDRWKMIKGWDSILTARLRRQYFNSLGLFQGNLKQNPTSFFRNAGTALLEEPRLFWSQALRLFSYSPDVWRDTFQEQAWRLLTTFDCKWPPTVNDRLGTREESIR